MFYDTNHIKNVNGTNGIMCRWARTLAKRKKDGFPVEKMLGKWGPRSPHPKRMKNGVPEEHIRT
jgi:hypothetical protein